MEWQDLQYHLDHYVEDSLLWQSRADIITPYEDILNFPLQVVIDLSKSLEISLSRREMTALLKQLDMLTPAKLLPESHLNSVDQTTFLHNGHIGDKFNKQASSRLPPKIKKQIEDRYNDWLCAHGYSLG